MSEGWICPKCGTVWAPWVSSCSCKTATGSTATHPLSMPTCDHDLGPADPNSTSALPRCRKCGAYVFGTINLPLR